MYLNFSKGSLKYYGLLEAAKKYGFVKQVGAWYEVPSYTDKQLRLKDFLNDDKVWMTFIDEFNKRSELEMSYSGNSDESIDDMLDDVTEELDEIEG